MAVDRSITAMVSQLLTDIPSIGVVYALEVLYSPSSRNIFLILAMPHIKSFTCNVNVSKYYYDILGTWQNNNRFPYRIGYSINTLSQHCNVKFKELPNLTFI